MLSIIGIGDAIINWKKTPKGVQFPKGADIQVKMRKHDDGRWFVKDIISINGVPLESQQQQKKSSSKKRGNNQSSGKKKKQKKGVLNRLLRGTAGNLRKLYLYAMGGTDIDLQKLESRAQSLAPFIEYTELAKKSQEHLKNELGLFGK